MSDEVFQRYSQYYDLLYRDKDYAAEANYIARVLRAAQPEVSKLLEFGSGTGRHGRLLAQQGFWIKGVERSEAMVAASRRADDQDGFECVVGDIRSIRVRGTFDAVISLFHVVSYLTCNEDIRLTFENAAHHLTPGGLFLFDVWHGPAVLVEKPSVRVKRVENDLVRLTRIAEPEIDTSRSVVMVRYTVLAEKKSVGELVTFKEEHRVRYFFPVEIELFAANAGFEVVRCEEFQTGKIPSSATWGVVYLLRKRG